MVSLIGAMIYANNVYIAKAIYNAKKLPFIISLYDDYNPNELLIQSGEMPYWIFIRGLSCMCSVVAISTVIPDDHVDPISWKKQFLISFLHLLLILPPG